MNSKRYSQIKIKINKLNHCLNSVVQSYGFQQRFDFILITKNNIVDFKTWIDYSSQIIIARKNMVGSLFVILPLVGFCLARAWV